MSWIPEVARRITHWMATRGFENQMLQDAYLDDAGDPSDTLPIGGLMSSSDDSTGLPIRITRSLNFILHMLPKRMESSVFNVGRCLMQGALNQNDSRGEILQLDLVFVGESANLARAKGIVVDLIESLEIAHSSTRLRPIKLSFIGPAGVVEVNSNYSTSDPRQAKPHVVGCTGVIRPEVWDRLGLDPDRLGIYAGLNMNILGDILQTGTTR